MCAKCKNREANRRFYGRKSMEERREIVRRRDSEKVRAADRARWPARKGKADYAQKTFARGQVQIALREGRIRRGPCRVCGSPNTQAHHADYSKPLEVDWLCTEHHAAEHRSF
jgi:hypothetical protein